MIFQTPSFSVFAAIVLNSPSAWAINTKPNANNHRFYAESSEANNCYLPPYQENATKYPEAGRCEVDDAQLVSRSGAQGLAKLTDSEVQGLAEAYAPVLFFHPLEKYTLKSVSSTFANASGGQIYSMNKERKEKSLFSSTLTPQKLFETSPDLKDGENFFFEHELNDEYLAGDGFIDGKSRASIHYNVFDSGNGTIVFNYWAYFAYNGELTLAAFSDMGTDDPFLAADIMPFGAHEGDWETVSVQVCAAPKPSQPLAVQYHTGAGTLQTDCSKGECHFFEDSHHPVGFVAYANHAIHPVSSANIFTYKFPLNYFNVPGNLYMVDRTNYKDEEGGHRYWFPNATNLLRLKDPQEVALEARNGVETTSHEGGWMSFGGRWGDSAYSRARIQMPLKCLEPMNHLSYGEECPYNYILDLVVTLLDTPIVLDALAGAPDSEAQLVTGLAPGPYGPAAQPCYSAWLAPATFMIRDIDPGKLFPDFSISVNTTSEQFCLEHQVYFEATVAEGSKEDQEESGSESTTGFSDSEPSSAQTVNHVGRALLAFLVVHLSLQFF